MTRKILKRVIKKAEAVQMNNFWMRVQSYNFTAAEHPVLSLEPSSNVTEAVSGRSFTWQQLLKAEANSNNELVLQDGTRLKFFKLTEIEFTHA